MEVIGLLLILALAVIALAIVAFLLGIVWLWLPTAIGIVGGLTVIGFGYENLGVILMLVSFVIQGAWWNDFVEESSTSTPILMRGKKKRYNKDGEVIGYEDRND